jgi:hypothetical protein
MSGYTLAEKLTAYRRQRTRTSKKLSLALPDANEAKAGETKVLDFLKQLVRDQLRQSSLRNNQQKAEGKDIGEDEPVPKTSTKQLLSFAPLKSANREHREYLANFIYLLFGVEAEEISNISEVLFEDRAIIRQKYNLPDRELLASDPSEYLRRLKQVAQENGVQFDNESDLVNFFKNNQSAAVHWNVREKTVDIPVIKDRHPRKLAIQRLPEQEHELIHILQHRRYPNMPLYRKEYEACLAATASDEEINHRPFTVFDQASLSIDIEDLM